MRRMFLSFFALLAVAGAASGCQIPKRLVCETRDLTLDVQRVIFGIDYPRGQPETFRQRFYGIPAPGDQSPCD